MILYHARWVFPIAAPPIEHGAVGVDGGRIVYVGPQAGAPAGEARDLGLAALLPGLVNVHTHLELTVMRGFLEDLDFQPWLWRLTTARRSVLSRDDLADSARAGIAEGLLAGITTYADTCESGVVLDALVATGVRGVMYQEVFGPSPDQCAGAIAGLRDKVAALRPAETALARLGVSPHAPYSVSDDLFAATADLAREGELPVAVHIAESEAELAYVASGGGLFADSQRERGLRVVSRGTTPILALERTSLLERRPLLIHCVQATGEEIGRIAAHDCAIAHCPASNAKLGHGVAPLGDFLAAGIRVGLGTDSVASNNRMDLLDEARLASLVQRGHRRHYAAHSAAAMLELATLGGAQALDLAAEIGSLEPGKAADLAAFPLDGPRTTPVGDPLAALVFAAAGVPARLVTVAGRELVRDGRLVAPMDDVLARVRAKGEGLASAVRE
jgi:cytosine/adenosine deaminase-related metal-dependent hydrolase